MIRGLKSLLAGVVVGVVVAVLCLIVEFGLTVNVSGSNGLGAASGSANSFQYAAPIGFAAGFYWQFRRSPKAR